MAKNPTQITGTSKQTKFPKGPVTQHKSLATGDSLSSASSEQRVGGSKSDRSNKTNK